MFKTFKIKTNNKKIIKKNINAIKGFKKPNMYTYNTYYKQVNTNNWTLVNSKAF